MRTRFYLLALSPLAPILASCSADAAGEKAESGKSGGDFQIAEIARFDEPWALAFIPGTPYALITEKKGKLIWLLEDGQEGGAGRLLKLTPR